MSKLLFQLFKMLMLALLSFCRLAIPAGFLEADPSAFSYREDPSYEQYKKYRYAYDTYGYLFLSEESGGENTEEDTEEYTQLYTQQQGVIPVEGNGIQPVIDWDYNRLMENCYSVHASTVADRGLFQVEKLMGEDLKIEKDSSVPQILVYHTHTQETYADYGPGNLEANVVGIGNYLTELLQAKGWNVIHDVSSYDMKEGELDRNRAYTYALEGITGILQENPTVQVILDIHRDGVREGLHLVSEVEGKQTAQIMFFQGMSQTPDGPIEYLPNAYIPQNLAFSFQMQMWARQYYPKLTRKIYLKGLRYNLHLRPRSALVEVGAQTNTYQEARNAMEPLAELLDMVLQGN